jgi:CDP-glycerol glycerophosphotransferase (TagB/SpsB family)
MRIGFLFNHDQVHQVAHSLPIALALARAELGLEIVVATTNRRLTAEVVRLGAGLIGHGVDLVELDLTRRASRVLAATAEAVLPATKLLVYGDNLDFFRSLDILVVAEKTSLILKTRYGLNHLKIIHTRHGAGDRAIGFDKASAGFDHVLVSGRKVRDRLVGETGVDPEKISVVGYPKFDLLPRKQATHPLIDDGRLVVLYNPHVSPHLSSWYEAGRQVLDWFVEHDDHHLIFAPHVMLFERPFVVTIDKLRLDRAGRIEERYLRAPNIHIDLGSRTSTTMAYTQRADIYLGDVSSQVYEFLLKPRPCVFLNSHRHAWQGDPNYGHWRAGPVIETPDQLGAALISARIEHEARWRPAQLAMFAESFNLTGEPSAVRAARVVARIAGLNWPVAALAEPERAHG